MKHLLLALCLIFAAFTSLEAAGPPRTGGSLAELRLFDLAGRQHRLDEVTSRYVVVVWWAYWCDTWKKALPSVQDLAARQQELQCTVWTVSVDGRYTAEVRPLVERGTLGFPALLDDGGWTKRLGLRRVPTVMVLDEQRTIIWVHEAYPGNKAIEQAIRKAINTTPAGTGT